MMTQRNTRDMTDAAILTLLVTAGATVADLEAAWIPALAVFTWPAAWVSIIDLREQRIPTRIVYPASALLTLVITVTASITHSPHLIAYSLLGGIASMASWYLLALLTGGYGMGDVRLALLCGLAAGLHGWRGVLGAMIAAIVIGGVSAILAKIVRPSTTHLPFGPSLSAGALLALAVTPMT